MPDIFAKPSRPFSEERTYKILFLEAETADISFLSRLEEILSLSENPKQPSTTVYLKNTENTNIERAQELKYSLEYTSLKDITRSVSICFDPDDWETLIDEDKQLMAEYAAF